MIKTRFLSALLCILMLLSLGACGKRAPDPIEKIRADGSKDVYEFDTEERVTVWKSYLPSGDLYFTHTYSYEDDAVMASRSFENTERTQDFTYDDQGRSILEVTHYDNGYQDTTTYTYEGSEVTLDCSSEYDGGLAKGIYTHTLADPENTVMLQACAYNAETGTIYYILLDEINPNGDKVATHYGELKAQS